MKVSDYLTQFSIEPRPYQIRVISKTIRHYTQDALPSVLIESATGSGKTVMALIIAKYMQEYHNLKIGWVAMRRNLLGQAEKENKIKGIDANIEFISMFEKVPPKVDLLVIDEAQHDATASCSHLHNIIQPKFILGLSATPFRADRVKLCFTKIVKDAGIRILIKDGWLSPFHHYSIPKWDVPSVCWQYMKHREMWGKSIMFFSNLSQCFQAKQLLQGEGVEVEVVTGSSNREEQISGFADGKTEVLINCMVLTEGFDCPKLQTVFCRDASKGVTMQMCGRSFRKFPGISHKNIVQSVDTKWPFTKTATPLANFTWKDGQWCSLKLNESISTVHSNTLTALRKIDTKLPSLLTRDKKGSIRRIRNLL